MSHRYLFALLLMLPVAPVFATEWVIVDRISSKGITKYVDRESIRKSGEELRVWVMLDYGESDRHGNRSIKAHWLVRCEEGTYAPTQMLSYHLPLGRGDVAESWIANQNQIVYIDAVPGSIGQSALRFACS
jgi:hypothetical protein